MAFIGSDFGARPTASGGVEGVRYERSAPSGAAAAGPKRSAAADGSLLGVGIPDSDLSLLLLIPLLVIALIVLDLARKGTRRGPLDRFFKRG